MPKIIRIKPDEIIVDMSSERLSWQDWHQLIIHIVQLHVDIQQPIKLILLTNPESDISNILGETIDYLLDPVIFREIYISGPANQLDKYIRTMIHFMNLESDVMWYYIPSQEFTAI